MTHDELAHNLANFLAKNTDKMVWEDVPSGSAGSVRPDVFVINKSFSNPNPITYEVKVSINDFRSDITSGKWKNYLKFSSGVVFAVPKGLITKKDLPDGCGLVTFNGEFWNTVKRPTLNNVDIDNEFLLKLLIGGKQRMTEYSPSKHLREFNEVITNKKMLKEYGSTYNDKLYEMKKYKKEYEYLTNIREEICNIFDIEYKEWGFVNEVKHHMENLNYTASEDVRKNILKNELLLVHKSMQHHIDMMYRRITDDHYLDNEKV